MSHVFKVWDYLLNAPMVHSATIQQQQELIEELEDISSRLVDGAKDHEATISQFLQRFDNAEGSAAIQASGGLIQE